jgi:hypothetical protein
MHHTFNKEYKTEKKIQTDFFNHRYSSLKKMSGHTPLLEDESFKKAFYLLTSSSTLQDSSVTSGRLNRHAIFVECIHSLERAFQTASLPTESLKSVLHNSYYVAPEVFAEVWGPLMYLLNSETTNSALRACPEAHQQVIDAMDVAHKRTKLLVATFPDLKVDVRED